jgi:hypothetical protein
MQNAKQVNQGCSNPSLPNLTKATTARMGLERKNKGGGQLMTPRSRSQRFSSLRGGKIGGDYRSRSPLPTPSKRCKNHRRDGGGRKLLKVNNGGQFRAQEL